MTPTLMGIVDPRADSGRPSTSPPRRPAVTTALVGCVVLAGVLLAVAGVSAVTTRSHTVQASVSSIEPALCLHVAGSGAAPAICLTAFHVSHLHLQSASTGTCLTLTYSGRLSAAALTGAWAAPCPTLNSPEPPSAESGSGATG